LFARLKVYIYWPMAVLALSLVVLAVWPAMAQAQGMAATKDAQGTERVVVGPGDSLWLISEERLGPNATPQQVANGVERIYALNRNRIGGDPNLLFPGQELLLPPVGETSVSEPSRAEPSTRAAPAREANEPAEASATDRVAKSGTTRQASRTPVREVDRKDGPETLPEEVAGAPVPDVRSLASNDPPRSWAESVAEVRTDAHRLLGSGILVLAGIATVLGASACTLAVRRRTRRRELWFRETYGRNYAAFDPFASHKYAPRLASEVRHWKVPSGGSKNGGTASENHLDHVGLLAIARAKLERVRREQSLGLGRPLRRYPAPDTLGPEVRSSLRQQLPTWSQRRRLRARRRVAATTAVAAAKRPHAQHEEWVPSVALRSSLGAMPLHPTAVQREAMPKLKPHLEEAVSTLSRLERQRGLSDQERHRKAALRMLLAASKEVE
jgi:hypothetical protein